MFRIMWNGTSGMYAEQEKLDAIANNLANSSTVGYKSQSVSFSDLVYETINGREYPVSNGNDPINGTGVKANDWMRDNTQGTPSETDKKTDFAIVGDGYFRVTRPDGSKAYERNGQFSVDGNGRIVDSSGNILDIQYKVNPNSVQFSDSNIVLAENGEIGIRINENQIEDVGKVNLYNVVGDDSMTSIGDNLFSPKNGAQVSVVGNSQIKQGFVEESNVDMVTELTGMIVAQRAYEFSSKSLKTADEMWQLVNSLSK
ncbi:flagellar basal body rod protein FlgG [Clostridium sp. DMHC 10]|uniref:flagellar hook-basal body complex protein n=1 Tax=Clostridium sp. DMHC 10 TaxID=747377 RepID=UPI00069CE218|nr:flagellar hook-basal body complex protein [Clostridium sp. DMHC 10]KOF57820.1 flagellar basal body rod protein FlgG [Clostridium sp. DMHC 10]